MHPYPAKPFGALPEQAVQASPPTVRIPHPQLGYLLKPTMATKPLGNKKLKLDPVFTQHFFHCTGHAEQLLLYSYGTICYLKVNTKVSIFFFSIPHTYKQKIPAIGGTVHKAACFFVVSFIAQG